MGKKESSPIVATQNTTWDLNISSVYFGSWKIHSEWYAVPYVDLVWFQALASIHFVCNVIFHGRMWNYFECFFLSKPKHMECHIQTESELICKQNLTTPSAAHVSWAAQLFEVNGIQIIDVQVHRDHPYKAYFGIFGWTPFVPWPRTTVFATVNSSRWAVNRIYPSFVPVIAHGLPCLPFHVSHNRFQSFALTLLAFQTASATLRCVSPDSTILICQTVDLSESHCSDILKSLFSKHNWAD